MKLYSFFGSHRTNKILVTAALAETPVELVAVDFAKIKDAEFLKKNPNGKVPVLETKDGSIFESNAIVRFLARTRKDKHLYGTSEIQEAHVDQWLDWCSGELEPPIVQLVLPVLGWMDFDKEKNKKALTDVITVLRILDNHLKINSNIVGNHLTIADVAIANALVFPFKYLWEEKFRKTIPSVTKWFEATIQHQAFTQVWGKIRLCQKQFEVAQIEKPAPQPKAQPAKTEKPAAKPKEVKEDDEEVVEKPKEKNPLDVLPPTKFNLFDFKTLFVNAPDKQEALDFFWNNYDPEGYSLYFVHYQKYEGEGKVLFQTCNMKNGFIQRLEHFRKYAFAVHGVYGEEPNLEIQGVWVWRGVGIPSEIKELDSYEYHDWVKLDHNSEADRARVNAYWSNLKEDSTVEGFRVRDASYFK